MRNALRWIAEIGGVLAIAAAAGLVFWPAALVVVGVYALIVANTEGG